MPDDQKTPFASYADSIMKSLAKQFGLTFEDLSVEYKAVKHSSTREWLLAMNKAAKAGSPKWVCPRKDY